MLHSVSTVKLETALALGPFAATKLFVSVYKEF